jgi:hypothetical protein
VKKSCSVKNPCGVSIFQTVLLVFGTVLLAALAAPLAFTQNVNVRAGKRATAIPKICESLVSISLDGAFDIPALVKEADCKGAGDMLIDYTYVMKFERSALSDKGKVKKETVVYEVYMPTPKGGVTGRGVLLETSRDGRPVPPDELEKERLKAGERLEKEEARSAHAPDAPPEPSRVKGLLPVGMYPRSAASRSAFGFKRGSLVLDLHTFLRTCELKLLRREQVGGREALVFSFTPRLGAQFDDEEKYIAQLTGTIWIDAEDRIVTRLEGRPAPAATVVSPAHGAKSATVVSPSHAQTPPGEQPPAVLVALTRLPEGVWLPSEVLFNGADYPKLFDRVNYEMDFTYGEYKRFNTETKDVKLDAPKAP